MLLRLIILTSLAMFATLSLANRMEAVDRVVESGAPEAVTVERISTPFATPMVVAADGRLIAEAVTEPEAVSDATDAAVEAVLAEVAGAGEPAEGADATGGAPALPVQFVTATRVNLRAGPGTDNAVIGQVEFADAVSVVALLDNGWAEIQIEGAGGTGFVAARFLADTPPG